jgi:alanyl-tRNA synthetase
MKAQEIREKFTNYFMQHAHEKIASSPLIPQDDPTLLFANAGMNQFKDYFTGKANPKNRRATTIQKCVRAGGKHNDLENVGFTARHHTFFEMLGNFSFGDYFKSEAIEFAWQFLTEELKIPKDKLYVTCHDSDQEAADIWHKEQGVPRDRIFFMGDKDNFWEMGEVGPCGPCSEIFYDHGEEYSDGADTSQCLLADEGRYVEIWNLVFMQYEKYKDGDQIKRRDLPKPSVDTGCGLERLAAVMQNVYWNYDIDSFQMIMDEISKLSGKKYTDKKYQGSFRVIADHIRATTMLITDGVMPGSDGRGYVLRRIIRRAVRHLSLLGIKETSFYKLVPSVFDNLAQEYPENKANEALASKLLKIEEEKFRKTLDTGLELINKEIKKVKSGQLFDGKKAFMLYDTYGFPLDLTETILDEHKINLDTEGFDKAMAKQRENSKKASKFAVQEDNLKLFYQIKEKNGETEFTGYNSTESNAKLLSYDHMDDAVGLVFDKTPFYGESGGQAGDIGVVEFKGKTIASIVDTQKPVDGLHVHFSNEISLNDLKIGETYNLKVNESTRRLTMRNHSATHLLQAALIEVLGEHVKQAGSMNGPDRLRFDFTHPEAVTKSELIKIEDLVNEKIMASLDVVANIMTKDEAQEKGAMALFGEKYGDQVRVLEMGDFSIELCGGTHVKNTNDIGLFTILSESSLSSGVRRIEATTSVTALKYLSTRSRILENLERTFSAKDEAIIDAVENSQLEMKKKNKEIKTLKDQLQSLKSSELFNNKKTLGNNVIMTIADATGMNPKEFRSLSDKFTDKDKEGVLVLYAKDGEKLSALIRTHKQNKKIDCGKALKDGLSQANGRGGGRPDMAQGSGDSNKLRDFLAAVEETLSAF